MKAVIIEYYLHELQKKVILNDTQTLLTCWEGQIALLSISTVKQSDLVKVDFEPISKILVLSLLSFRKLAESQSLISAKYLVKEGGEKELEGLEDR